MIGKRLPPPCEPDSLRRSHLSTSRPRGLPFDDIGGLRPGSSDHSSYFRAFPYDFSTGYLASFFLSFERTASFTSSPRS